MRTKSTTFLISVISLLILYGFAHNRGAELPMGYNSLFAGSGECLMCHNDQVNLQGESVSIVSDWRSTMMANSVKDPFWRAKVSHEVLVNPDLENVIEDKCTSCHAPVGHFNAHHLGQQYYTIEEMDPDPLARDGVQCTVCHQITQESMGSFSGHLVIGEEKITWGPFEAPFTTPMINNTGYTPAYGAQINDSRLCANCHTLLTPTVDLNGQLTGNEFVEQAIYHEWRNSSFPNNGLSCQSCHIPRIDDPVKISSMPPWLDPRLPFGMHHFAGANAFMLKMLKEHSAELGITAEVFQLDSTLARVDRMLQNNTLSVNLTETARTDDTLFIDLQLINLAGHKFPSGFPSRRAFISLLVQTQNEDTLFHSGRMDQEYQLPEEDEPYETHYDLITSEDQVQLYEMVMGDVSGQVTTTLLRADQHIKDNRLPPAGFNDQHNAYDTVAIAGMAIFDPDFNIQSGFQGSGADIVHYHIPVSGHNGLLTVTASVYYQTVSSRWLEDAFSNTSAEIDQFESYYNQSDLQPLLVASASMQSTVIGLHTQDIPGMKIFPNPAQGIVYCQLACPEPGVGSTINCQNIKIGLYDINSKLVREFGKRLLTDTLIKFDLRQIDPGIYFFVVQTETRTVTKKLVVI
jgi:hypothetical protein